MTKSKSRMAAALAALAPAFNALLGIGEGFFGYSPRQSEPGAGVQRAAARLAQKRLENANIPDIAMMSRQQRRAAERAGKKRAVSIAKAEAVRQRRHTLVRRADFE